MAQQALASAPSVDGREPSLPPEKAAPSPSPLIGAATPRRDAEVDDPRYAANPANRCYYCKSELYTVARKWASEHGFAAVANGTNLDDLGDYRPGLEAAKEAGVQSPLVDAGFRKDDVRRLAHTLGLSVWDKPAAACLSSRLPYGTAVTRDRMCGTYALARRGLNTICRARLSVLVPVHSSATVPFAKSTAITLLV